MHTRYLVIVAIIILSGCTSYPIQDLEAESVNLIDAINEKEIVSRFKGTDSRLKKLKFLKVELTTKENLALLAEGRTVPYKPNAFFCDEPKSWVILNWSSLYWKGFNISDYGARTPPGLTHHKSGKYTYYTYLWVNHSAKVSSYKHFDLESNPMDICIKLIAREPAKIIPQAVRKSNTVLIPKEVIRRSFK